MQYRIIREKGMFRPQEFSRGHTILADWGITKFKWRYMVDYVSFNFNVTVIRPHFDTLDKAQNFIDKARQEREKFSSPDEVVCEY